MRLLPRARSGPREERCESEAMPVGISVPSAQQSWFCSGRATGLQSGLEILRLPLPVEELSHRGPCVWYPSLLVPPPVPSLLRTAVPPAEDRQAGRRAGGGGAAGVRVRGGHAPKSCWRGRRLQFLWDPPQKDLCAPGHRDSSSRCLEMGCSGGVDRKD